MTDTNLRPLVSESTTLPNEPQPQPNFLHTANVMGSYSNDEAN